MITGWFWSAPEEKGCDPLREEAKPAIARCRDAGIRTIMLTGDQPATAAAIARQLGLEAVKLVRAWLAPRVCR